MNRLNLVTGGAGFIGRHLVNLLIERGEQVRILDLRDWPERPSSVELIQGSILNPQAVDQSIAGVTRLFHLAANPFLWAKDPNLFMDVNYVGTCRILEAAARANIPNLVYCSTESILKGRRKAGQQPIEETVHSLLSEMPGPYCRSKFLAEQAALSAAQNGMPVVIVNPTMPIGPGDYGMTPPMRMIKSLLDGTMPAYLEWQLNVVDARDVAVGHLLAAEKGRPGERYILGGVNLHFSALIREIEKLTDRKMPYKRIPYWLAHLYALISETGARITGSPPRAPIAGVILAKSPMIFDTRKAQMELGWKARPLTETLADAIQWLQSAKL